MRRRMLAEIAKPLDLDSTNLRISAMISSDEPFFVGRLGSTELRALTRWQTRKSNGIQKISRAMRHKHLPFFSRLENRKLGFDSGFYPITSKSVDEFAQLMVDAMKSVNLLGSWLRDESAFIGELSHAEVAELASLEPFFSQVPWTAALEGKKVLVVHPFDGSIREQFDSHRERIFEDLRLLPTFTLDVLPAVQTLAGPDPRFPTWFDALDSMEAEALTRDFDVAIIGCGAYGFPLAARLKKQGKKVIHLGGPTQLLFGIKGRRWDSMPRHRGLYNEYWVRPKESEKPVTEKQSAKIPIGEARQ